MAQGSSNRQHKKVLSAKEKVLKRKRKILNVVERLSEKEVSKEWFLSNSVILCQSDYNDVIQERSIEHLCGYPLCSKALKKVVKQQYHISLATNKVYDLTERKCFCSNECFKASNYVKSQLSEVPLYMRKEEAITINLLSDSDNKGSVGEEIMFHHKLNESEIEKVHKTEEFSSNHLKNILNEEIKKCTASLSGLQIKENTYENPYVFEGDESNEKAEVLEDSDDSDESDAQCENDVDDDEFKKYEFEHDNISKLSQKHMPIPEETKKVILIPPKDPSLVSVTPPNPLSLEFTRNVFKDWITEDTLKYLFGEKEFYSLKAEILVQRMLDSETISAEKLDSIKSEYINLSLKLDKMQDEEVEEDEIDILCSVEALQEPSASNCKGDEKASQEPVASSCKDVEKSNKSMPKSNIKSKSKKSQRKKNVAFKVEDAKCKSEVSVSPEESTDSKSTAEPLFPLVDSVSQEALRRQVLLKQLKSACFDLLPQIGMHYRDIRDEVRELLGTFSLTPTNIIFKPKEWKLISVVLVRMLTKTVLKNLHNEDQFSKLCRPPFVSINITTDEVDELVSHIINPQQLKKLQGFS